MKKLPLIIGLSFLSLPALGSCDIPLVPLIKAANAVTGDAIDAGGDSDAQATINPFDQQSVSGNYLAGRFARNARDWKNADKFMGSIAKTEDDNSLHYEAMISALSAGDMNDALEMANKVTATGITDDQQWMKDLPHLLLALKALKSEHFETATKTLEGISASTFSSFIVPQIMSWSIAAKQNGRDCPTETMPVFATPIEKYSPLQLPQAAMLSEYCGVRVTADKLYGMLASDTRQSAHIAEMAADYFARRGQKDKAKELYTLLLQRTSIEYVFEEKLNQLEIDKLPPEVYTPPWIENPVLGAAASMRDMAILLSGERNDDSAILFSRLSVWMEDGKNAFSNIVLADILARAGQREEARKYYLSVPQDSRYHYASRLQVADSYQEDGNIEQTILTLKNLAKDVPDRVDAQVQLGDLHRQNEDFAKAVASYGGAIKRLGAEANKPENWFLFYARGMCLERLNRWKDAELDLLKAVTMEPENPYAINYLAYSWADKGVNLDRAHLMLEKAVELAPGDGYITDSLGWVLYRMEKFEDAVPHLEKAVELLPYDPTINDHLGDAYWKVGRDKEAQFQWKRAINYANEDVDKKTIQDKLNGKFARN